MGAAQLAAEHMVNASTRLRIQLVGPFRMSRVTGEDCTPRQRKTCALIALLALAPDYKRSRVWIQDKLWSTRGKEQGSASLRQCLVEVRRRLGPDRDCLLADNYSVSLDRNLVSIDLDDMSAFLPHDSQDIEFLEGLDIGDQEFEDWLCGQRQQFHSRLQAATTRLRVADATADVVRAPEVASQNRLLLNRGTQTGPVSLSDDSLLDSIAKTISELGAADILDCRAEGVGAIGPDERHRSQNTLSQNTLSLHFDTASSNGNQAIRLALLQFPTNELVWTSTVQTPDRKARALNDPAMLRCVNLVVSIAMDQFAKWRAEKTERALSSALCHSGILHLFRLGRRNFEAADRLFARAFEIDPRGIHLAWRAYLRTFMLGELKFSCRQTIDAEAIEFMHRALEMEPHNSYVAGLSANVQAMMKRSYVAAFELAERSIQLNPANPIGWASLGIAKSYLGKPQEGFRNTLWARAIAGSAPYRFQLDSQSCIAGTIAGDIDKAIYLAEACHALAPDFSPPLRYLSALYLHKGREDLSLEMVRRLRTVEPDFSYEKLSDKAYPAAGLHRTAIIDSLRARQV